MSNYSVDLTDQNMQSNSKSNQLYPHIERAALGGSSGSGQANLHHNRQQSVPILPLTKYSAVKPVMAQPVASEVKLP